LWAKQRSFFVIRKSNFTPGNDVYKESNSIWTHPWNYFVSFSFTILASLKKSICPIQLLKSILLFWQNLLLLQRKITNRWCLRNLPWTQVAPTASSTLILTRNMAVTFANKAPTIPIHMASNGLMMAHDAKNVDY